MNGLRRRMVVTATTLFGLLLYGLWGALPAQAYDWGPSVSASNCQGNGCITLYYRIRVSYSYGFYLEGVRISAAKGGANFIGLAGRGASVWNENNVIKWSKDGGETTDLNPGQDKFWDTEITMANASKLAGGYYFTELYYLGGDINNCAKVLVYHGNVDKPDCG